ncbi:hypothetical protein I7I50_04635 [Histoplasma capsulatum G186AR]|uniref:Uncharacterized protein n=1 Tax=Ajellomyces capsulatus TaxID=5037 RepID=A0A8H8CXV2_AJECA|nr:hypothetical protein I7I52_05544 [Histoplasma capsulatum]QSS75487.1 hypothetical protein I7I50_04635 [Histoplasma capsulatum G186AR]
MVLAIAGLLFWCGIRSISSQGSIICEVAIHTLLVIITAGFAAGGLVHDWPLWIEAMLIITIGAYLARNISTLSGEPGNTVLLPNPEDTSNLDQLRPHQENRSARFPFTPSRDRAMAMIKTVVGFGTGATSMTEDYTQLDEIGTARPETAHLKIKAVISIYYPDLPILSTGIFTVRCEGREGNYSRKLRYNELTARSDGKAALQLFQP